MAAALVATGGFVAYRQFAPKSVPQVQAKTAKEAVDQLKRAGIPAKTELQFSPKRKGSFVRLAGADKDGHLPKGRGVTVTESAGPGVPKGTVGQAKDKAVTSLKAMEVPLTVADVVSSKPGDAGKVVASYPADGQAVSDPKEGIHVGVASDKAGIPIEIAGLDQAQARSQLEAKGYTVSMEPRFSSRRNLGKIVGANPSIGLPTDTRTVSLYYGVDASKKLDVVASIENAGNQSAYLLDKPQNLAGQYCTEGGDCLSLDAISKDEAGSSFGVSTEYLKVRGETIPPDNWRDYLSLCTFSQDPSGCIPPNTSLDEGAGYMKNHLISGQSGAFELYAGMGLPNCGTTPFQGGLCENGHISYRSIDELAGNPSLTSSGIKWKAKDFFVYMPVGAKLDQLESDGYFAGKPGFKPDQDRPYLIKRDNSKYQDRPADDRMGNDPYTPTQYGKAEPFQEAPNKTNVYYLVEDSIDWKALGGSSASGPSAAGASGKASQDFSALAGQWQWTESGDGSLLSTMTIQSDGSFTGGTYHRTDEPNFLDGETENFSGRFTKIVSNKDGTKTLTLDPESIQGVSDAMRDKSGVSKTTYTFVPAGQSIPGMDDSMRGAIQNYDGNQDGPTAKEDALRADGIVFIRKNS
ncbi:hypothetical protein CRD59_03575 [Bifidobacterium xylocopae]|uniref:Serine/threonine protein kinase n=1 Tax=Bifidobacterium xylocopae TaxID=2493119 RepID=A0A366KFJ0_9BIFI|nr:hypothetical protein CRD59_03575 [Bifidobacterium xylocopae]